MSLTELKKLIKDHPDTLIYGTNRSLKNIKLDKLKKVFLSNDCFIETEKKLAIYSKYSKFETKKLEQNREELSLLCEKKFPVSVIGVVA